MKGEYCLNYDAYRIEMKAPSACVHVASLARESPPPKKRASLGPCFYLMIIAMAAFTVAFSLGAIGLGTGALSIAFCAMGIPSQHNVSAGLFTFLVCVILAGVTNELAWHFLDRWAASNGQRMRDRTTGEEIE